MSESVVEAEGLSENLRREAARCPEFGFQSGMLAVVTGSGRSDSGEAHHRAPRGRPGSSQLTMHYRKNRRSMRDAAANVATVILQLLVKEKKKKLVKKFKLREIINTFGFV